MDTSLSKESKGNSAPNAAMQFPLRLHDILDQAPNEGFQHIISWLPDGKSFKIHEPESMLPILYRFGFNQSKWKSFLRQLQNYGFQRDTKGVEKGTCKHELFVRGRRDLCKGMRRIKKSCSADNVSGHSPVKRKLVKDTTYSKSTSALQNVNFDSQTMPSAVVSQSNLRRATSEESSRHNARFSVYPRGMMDGVAMDDMFGSSVNQPRRRGQTPQGSIRALAAKAMNRERKMAPLSSGLFETLPKDLFKREQSRDHMNALFLNEASIEETFGRTGSLPFPEEN